MVAEGRPANQRKEKSPEKLAAKPGRPPTEEKQSGNGDVFCLVNPRHVASPLDQTGLSESSNDPATRLEKEKRPHWLILGREYLQSGSAFGMEE
ncbi:unnamed protein product [Linum trigynum]|uniref:Uncharacterized protein n=1 Tax=Linum trigynum TaxID=586398 RepID=A0AAV2GCV2_9ROSI